MKLFELEKRIRNIRNASDQEILDAKVLADAAILLAKTIADEDIEIAKAVIAIHLASLELRVTALEAENHGNHGNH